MFTVKSLVRDAYASDSKATHIRPAGVTTFSVESIKDAVTWSEPPPTPPDQQKYRQSTLHKPGQIVRHPGAADDPLPEGPFGDKSVYGESVAQNMQAYPRTEISRWTLDRAEDVYESTKREPLGKAYVRGHRMPEGLGSQTGFPGNKTDVRALEQLGQVKTVVFPTDAPPEDKAKAHELYVKTHAAYHPGEQRRRNYDWSATGVNPITHSFGAVDKDNYQEGVRKALQPALDQTAPQPSKVSNKIYEDFKASSTDYLGKPKNLGAGDRPLPPDHAYGLPSLRHGPEPGVDQLLAGSLTPEEQGPDADLGKSIREGWRNIAPEGRAFGLPSIRTDIPLPRFKSCANTVNFGNEPDAQQLLRPPRSVERGVNEGHYMELRPRTEVQEIMAEAGIDLDSADFDRVFAMASEADGEVDACCLDTFFRARHHLLAETIKVSMPF